MGSGSLITRSWNAMKNLVITLALMVGVTGMAQAKG
ncbi:MAG: cytochrome c4, partial [Aeromonas sp.]|nr:cytochrome c4 [Aeromonas sp.]